MTSLKNVRESRKQLRSFLLTLVAAIAVVAIGAGCAFLIIFATREPEERRGTLKVTPTSSATRQPTPVAFIATHTPGPMDVPPTAQGEEPTQTPASSAPPTASPTATPSPTGEVSPTDTPRPTESPSPTSTSPASPLETPTVEPTSTFPSSVLPTPEDDSVQIDLVDKISEYVYIFNNSEEAQDLEGWVLISDRGDETCPLSGILESGEGILIWAMAEDEQEEGYNCGLETEMWDDDQEDTALLYDAEGQLVSQYP